MPQSRHDIPLRPAWIEIDLAQLRRNFEIINRDKSPALKIMAVVKDDAYGHGAEEVARTALKAGATMLATATVSEAMTLRDAGVEAPILILGRRTEEELSTCMQQRLTPVVSDLEQSQLLARLAKQKNSRVKIHIEVDTGLSRYGVRWPAAMALIKEVAVIEALELEGVMSHFVMSDELDKTFAYQQLERFQEVLAEMNSLGIDVPITHMCNTGGFLDLSPAHFDLVRIGILPLGVYPSQVCRRIQGLQSVMTVKSRLAQIKTIQKGDVVGYGMRYEAPSERRIAVLPLGFGDGYPRVRNQGEVLVRGRKAPIIGGVAMDALMIDITDIPQAGPWDEVVLMGQQGDLMIDAHQLAKLKNTVSYDIMTGWRRRLPRLYLNREGS